MDTKALTDSISGMRQREMEPLGGIWWKYREYQLGKMVPEAIPGGT